MLKDRGKMVYDNCLSSIIIMVQRHWRNYYFLALYSKFVKKKNISLVISIFFNLLKGDFSSTWKK